MARLYWSLSVALLFWQAPAQTVALKPPVLATIRIERVVKLLDGNTLSSSTSGRFYRCNPRPSSWNSCEVWPS